MMKRFARISPTELDKIKARALDPIALKTAWIEMSDNAELEMTRLADDQPDRIHQTNSRTNPMIALINAAM